MERPTCIFLHDEASWPLELRVMLDDKFEQLKQYVIEDRLIDQRAEEDVRLRVQWPRNPLQWVYDDVLERCKSIVASLDVAGYHGTRLHDSEIASIKAQGVRVLSGDFLAARIRERVLDNSISPDIAERLMAKHQADDENRRGKIFFAFNRNMLMDEGGFSRLFRYWGGESLYRLHSIDTITAPWLEKTGIPCIIEAAIPLASIASSYTDIPKRILCAYLLRRQVITASKDDPEGYVVEDIPSERVLRVIRFSDPEFASFTQCDRWDRTPN
jgi:hypothetical protein